MNTKLLQAAVLISTIAVFALNWFAATGGINGRTPDQVSSTYETQITPAGYAFIIWSLIYLGLIVFTIYQLLPSQSENKRLEAIRFPYILSCAANIGWIFAWHYELIPLSMLFMLGLLCSLAYINTALIETHSVGETVFTRAPFGIYFGWVTVATILNATILLVYFGIGFSPFFSAATGVLLVIAATVLGIMLRFKLNSLLYPVAIAWGLTAIGVKQSGHTAVVLATAFGMMALIFVGLWGYVKDR